jgi:hypothetical protein
MSGPAPAAIDELARRFPLVPRPRPALPPLSRQLAEIADLARTPPEHPAADARIATAHNKAALIASNCGQPDFARHLCWQHHHRYTDRHPWTARTARYALEPLVNLARLHIRDGRPDTAIRTLEALLNATSHGGIADIDGHRIDLGATIATRNDRNTIRRWLWTVTLAEGIRALARTGRWDDALTHAERHHGIGATLLDGRQIAVLAHALGRDYGTAWTLLTASERVEPWQDAVAHVLALLVNHCGGTPTASPQNGGATVGTVIPRVDAPDAFGLEVRLAIADLLHEPARCARVNELIRSAASVTDAALAKVILTHPARRHVPQSLLDRLTALSDAAFRPEDPGRLAHKLARALGAADLHPAIQETTRTGNPPITA